MPFLETGSPVGKGSSCLDKVVGAITEVITHCPCDAMQAQAAADFKQKDSEQFCRLIQ